MLSAMDILVVVTQSTSSVTGVSCIQTMAPRRTNCIGKCSDCASRDDFYSICLKKALLPMSSTSTNIPVSAQLFQCIAGMPTLTFEGTPENIEATEAFLAELEREGYVNIGLGFLNDKDSVAFCTLSADEQLICSSYFRPQQKISHHVGRFLIVIQSFPSDTDPIVCSARNTIYGSIYSYSGRSIERPESKFVASKIGRIPRT
jgi:hypothetical protein